MIDPERIRWAPKPPRRRMRVYTVPAGGTVKVIAAGPVRGVLTHWYDDKKASYPCTCPSEEEGLCAVQRPIWRGYLPSWWPNNQAVIMEVTWGAAEALPRLHHEDIVGVWLKFHRPAGKKQNPLYVEVLEQMTRAFNVKPYDPTERLLEMWGIKPSTNGNGEHSSEETTDEPL